MVICVFTDYPEIPAWTGKFYNIDKFDALFFGISISISIYSAFF
jgi:hypothetical protein